jgi:quinate dehydrogenase (quinone)
MSKHRNDMAIEAQTIPRPRSLLPVVFGTILLIIGGTLAIGGLRLAPWRILVYLIAGIVLVNTGALYVVRNPAAGGLYFLLLLATVVWSIAEVGTSFWGLVPRLAALVVLGVAAALVGRTLSPAAKWPFPLAAALTIVIVAVGWSVFQPHGVIEPARRWRRCRARRR